MQEKKNMKRKMVCIINVKWKEKIYDNQREENFSKENICSS